MPSDAPFDGPTNYRDEFTGHRRDEDQESIQQPDQPDEAEETADAELVLRLRSFASDTTRS